VRKHSPGWLSLRRDSGALTLSYVMIVPVFMLGIMTVVQASVWYLARETALAAARHGADVARTSKSPPGPGAAAAVAFARSAAPGFLTRVSANSRGSTATTVRITVTGQAPSLVPWMAIKITEVVTAPVERFVALGDPSSVAGWQVSRDHVG
jgi:Flp pilus assembly protein TadG